MFYDRNAELLDLIFLSNKYNTVSILRVQTLMSSF